MSKWIIMFWNVCLMNRFGVTSSLRVQKNLWLYPTNSMLDCHSTRNPASSDVIPASVSAMTYSCLLFTSPRKSAQTCVIQIFTENTTWSWLFLSPSIVLQNRRLGIIPVCSLLLNSQRDNTVCSWMCDECNWWDVPVANRMLDSTL